MRRIAAHWLLSDGQVVPSPLISLDSDGRIVAIEEWERLDNLAHTEFYAGAVVAGFVNARCRIELPLQGQQTEMIVLAAERKMQSEGVVAVGYNTEDNLAAQIADDSKFICRTSAKIADESCLLVPRSEGDSAELSRRLELLRSQGAEICLGSDLLATGEGPSMLAEMKLLKDVPLAELCQWATINPAKALGIDDEFGCIEVGRKCGLVLLEGISRDSDGVLRLSARTTSRRLA
jgi:hypothetical protein